MTKIAFSLALLVFFSSCSENKNQVEESSTAFADLPAGAVQENYPDNPKLVRVSVYSSGDQLSAQGDYLNGQKNGAWTEYHSNGLVKSITSFVEGKKQGVQVTLNDRGDLETKAYYHNDLLHGEWVQYKYTRVKEERFYLGGKREGESKKYHDNGKIMEESTYKNGVIDGTAIWYDNEGNQTIVYEYENGELVSTGE
ncbi:MAG: toxin-antitoxin system YwqK family antitoxin [Bacteroidota bacterium]